MSRVVALPTAAPAVPAPRSRQAAPRQPVRAGVPVYLQRVPADSPARARIADQVQSQAQRADTTTVQQASQTMAEMAGTPGAQGGAEAGVQPRPNIRPGSAPATPADLAQADTTTAQQASQAMAGASGATGAGSGPGGAAAAPATPSAAGAGGAAAAPASGSTTRGGGMAAPAVGAGQAGGSQLVPPGMAGVAESAGAATGAAGQASPAAGAGGGIAPGGAAGGPQRAGTTGAAQAAGPATQQAVSGSAGEQAGAGASASGAPSAEGAGQTTSEGGVEAADAGAGAPAAEGEGAQPAEGEGGEGAAASPAAAGSAGPAGAPSAGVAGGESTAAAGDVSADTGAGALATGDLVLIDVELAEHERWAGALGRVGEVASVERAGFIAEQVGSGFIGGAASGAAMGLGIGLVTRVVPAIGPAIGGAMALHGLVTRDWAATGATIGRFGEGNDTYEVLANTLASVSAVIDVVSGVLSVINGIVGVVQLAAIGIAAGATVLAFVTFGATAGVAIAAGELAVVCEEITVAINVVTGALDMVNAAVLSPCITLFRALHSFTADADPREVEANGADISSAAAASGAALGAWAGGRAAAARPRGGREEAPAPTRRPPHEAPPAAAGDGPVVRYRPAAEAAPGGTSHAETGAAPHPAAAPLELPAPGAASHPLAPRPASVEEIAASPGHRIADTAAPVEAAPAARPMEQLTLPGVDMTPTPRPAATPEPRVERPHPITPDIEIRGDFSDASLRVQSGPNRGAAQAGDIAAHQHQGGRGGTLISEHVTPGAQMRDMSFDPAHGAPDWQRTTPAGDEGRDYRRATTIVEHAPVSARKTVLDNADTAARQRAGGPYDPVEVTLSSLARHQQAVDDAIAAGEITLPQATDPTHRALAALTELSGAGEAGGGAMARADAAAAGRPDRMPRSPARLRAREHERAADRLAGETIRDIDWEGTIIDPRRSAPPGTQFELPGMEGMGPRPAAAPAEQLTLPGFDRPMADPRQRSFDFEAPPRTTPETALRIGEGSTRSEAPLTDAQYQQGLAMAVEMGMPADAVHRASGDTSYHPGYDALLLGPDLHPRPVGERPTGGPNPANAALEPRAVIGHEVIGHREAALGGSTRDEVWHEELQASVRAALHTPDLPPEQVRLLTTDAAARRRLQTREGEIYVDTGRYGPAAPAPVRTPRPPDAEPSVIVDWEALGLPRPAGEGAGPRAPTATGAASAAAGPPARPAEAASPGGAGNWVNAAREGREATQQRIRSGGTGAGEASSAAGPSDGTGTGPAAAETAGGPSRAQQLGALFLPQFFGPSGPAPTYAEQRAAHRARFTADNQPAEGVERVNPHYNAPPATPAQIVEIQNQILNLLSVRALAEQEAEHQGDRAEACEENAGPIAATVADTAASQTALAEHQAAVARREAANQAQQQRQAEAGGLVAGYPSRATGLAALEVPLTAWRGFTSLASHLPGSAGDRMAEMNREADTMQDALTEMGSQMLGTDAAQPAQAAAIEGDAAVLSATAGEAQASGGELQTSAEGAAGLQSANEAALSEARRRAGAAEQREGQLADAAAEREQRADTLAEQLQQWAQQHQAQRQQAIAAATERLQAEGHAVTGSTER